MGAYSNTEEPGGRKSKKRGSTKNADRLQAFASGGSSGAADWGGCDATKIQAVVVGITERTGAVIFGLSRDQGAHSITLLLGSKKKTLWFNGGADLDDELDAVIATLDQMDS